MLDELPGADTDREDVDEAVGRAAKRVADSPDGASPTTITPKIPVVAVTGTNGKTTTSRMIAHIARTWGKHVGWSNTDGIYIDGELVEAGDYSGPSGAGRVLAHEEVEIAVTETARGGILLKGIGLTRNDVSVVTNISADHLGLQGIDTLDQLAEVKAVVPHITRKSGWAVLNADDPRVFAMRQVVRAQPWVVLARPRLARRPRDPQPRRPGHERHRRLGLRPQSPRRSPPAGRAGRRPDDPGRAVAVQRRERPGRSVGRPRRRHPAGEGGRGPHDLPPGRRAQPRPDELLQHRRDLGGLGPRPQRGGARGDGRDHERRTPVRCADHARPRRRRRPAGRPARAARRDRRHERRRGRHRSQAALPARPHASRSSTICSARVWTGSA